ncbi:hypothetical protein SDC9_119912 [bioreactor metagenome]|uniref:Uncharacterized protein n=1 Tax=bioreactor metagenome TaxID=1076179 RepID=A0A645C559_9ZZZZ
MFLREIAELEAMARHDFAGVGCLDAGQQPQQGCLACTVEPEDDHPRALVDRQVDAGEDLQGAVVLGEILGHQRCLAARRGAREGDLGHLVDSPLALGGGEQLLGAPGHVLRSRRLGRLGAELLGLQPQLGGLALGILAFALATLLVQLALLKISGPAHRILIEGGAVGVQVEDLGDGLVEQPDIVADHHHTAVVGLDEVAQPDDRVGIQVVGRLVEQQRVGGAEQNARQFDAAALTTGQLVQRLAEHPLG